MEFKSSGLDSLFVDSALVSVVLLPEGVVIFHSAVVFLALERAGIVVEITTMAFRNERNNIFCHT